MRLGLDEQGVTELMAAADQARGLAKLAAGLRLDPDILQTPVRAPLVPAVAAGEAGPRVDEVLAEILAWARDEIGIDHVPALWRCLGHHPVYLDAVWRRDKAIMADGKVNGFRKRCVGYAVAVNAGSTSSAADTVTPARVGSLHWRPRE
jgi:hypothetical protein